MKHLVGGSIAAWDCKHFIEVGDEEREDLQCKKGHDVCEGRSCPDFEPKEAQFWWKLKTATMFSA